MKRAIVALGVAAALGGFSGAATAAKQTVEQRIAAMEAHIQALEAEVKALKAAQTGAVQTPQTTANALAVANTGAVSNEVESLAADASTSGVASTSDASLAATPGDAGSGGAASNANSFNPAISLILNGFYTHHSLDPAAYARAGFPLVGEGRPLPQGFSLGESEISMSANIDDKFYGQLTLAVGSDDGKDEIALEEAYIDTTALPAGFNLRLGRFYSNIGYLNSHHPHTDSFVDRPLPYQAFLAKQYGDDGLQVRWVAPTSTFIELGGELLRGQHFPSAGAARGGIGTRTLFAHVGGSAGQNNEWLAGVSMLNTRANSAEDGFSGNVRMHIIDGTWKWAPQGNFKDGGITLRGEYFDEHRDGTFVDPAAPGPAFAWVGTRRGAYLEGVYRFSRTWDAGLRHDRLWADAGGPFASAFDPSRTSAQLTWRNSEFSLFRMQWNHDRPNPADVDNSLTLQYQTSLGAHGAHKF